MAYRLVVLEWLYKADQDFGFAQLFLKRQEKEYFDQICFFFQQAAEKYLKAYIVKFDLEFEKQHDLVKILHTCTKHDKSLDGLKEECRFLTSFYFETRYPDQSFIVASKTQAVKASKSVQEIRDLVREKLGVQHEVSIDEIKKENNKVEKEMKKRK